ERFTQVDSVIDLLAQSTSPAAQPGARKLLQEMTTTTWRVIRGAHRSDDLTWHILVAIGKKRYHLRLDGRSCICDITYVSDDETQRLAGHKPWVGPGA